METIGPDIITLKAAKAAFFCCLRRKTLSYIPKVYDVRPEGHQSLSVLPRLGVNDFAALQDFYKFELDFSGGYDRATPGQRFFGIDAIELKAGPAVFQPQVLDENGSPIVTSPGILMFNHWPGAPDLGFTPDPNYHPNAVAGFTENGTIGWGYGADSHIGDNGGVHSIWCSADPVSVTTNRRVGSDAIKKLGWWDDHITPNPIFKVMIKGGQPPAGDVRLVIYDAQGNQVGYVNLLTGGAPGQGRIALVQGGIETGHVLLTT